jgi:hypothetical protein
MHAPHRVGLPRRTVILTAGLLAAISAAAAMAPEPIVGPPIAIGETGVAVADPLVSAPPETPCVVKLYTANSPTGTFDDYAAHPFDYAPPSGCKGPWNKVVFKADFNVSTGRQYDRTASVWVGGVNLYFGTTQEPSASRSPSWHVERDVTNLSALLMASHPGNAVVYNIYNSTYNGSITGSAELDFYPATPEFPAPRVPDQVLSLGSDPAGNAVSIYTDQTPMARTFTLPTNVDRAYLEVTAEPQSGDEFWYSCGPDSIIFATGCGGTGFREAEITLDGKPAGFVPISTWIYTGGVDPYLWRPIPGVQTLDFLPSRVDITPFAALLSNGQPHTISVSVATGDPAFQNNSQRFDTAATLLLYQDAGSAQITGGLIGAVGDSGVHPDSTLSGSGDVYDMNVTSSHKFNARGYVNTSHGQVTTVVAESASFGNHDVTTNGDTVYEQNIAVQTSATSTSTTIGPSGTSTTSRNWSFPLQLDYKFALNPDGTSYQATTVDQRFTLQSNEAGADGRYASSRYQTDNATDTLNFDSSGNFTGPVGQQSSQTYRFNDSTGACYSRTVDAAAGAVTQVKDGIACQGSGQQRH